MVRRSGIGAAIVALLVLIVSGVLIAQSPPPITADQFKQLRFRYIGPVGNRIIAIAGRSEEHTSELQSHSGISYAAM